LTVPAPGCFRQSDPALSFEIVKEGKEPVPELEIAYGTQRLPPERGEEGFQGHPFARAAADLRQYGLTKEAVHGLFPR
jgi:hypothetical protein